MKDEIKKYVIPVVFFLFFIIYTLIMAFNVYNNYSNNKSMTDEISNLNSLIKKEKKYSGKIEDLGVDFNSKMFFEKEEDFEAYIRKTLYKYTKEYIKYESKDVNEKQMKISVVFKIKANRVYKFIDDLEYGNKFVVIDKISMKRVDTPYVEVSLFLKGFYL